MTPPSSPSLLPLLPLSHIQLLPPTLSNPLAPHKPDLLPFTPTSSPPLPIPTNANPNIPTPGLSPPSFLAPASLNPTTPHQPLPVPPPPSQPLLLATPPRQQVPPLVHFTTPVTPSLPPPSPPPSVPVDSMVPLLQSLPISRLQPRTRLPPGFGANSTANLAVPTTHLQQKAVNLRFASNRDRIHRLSNPPPPSLSNRSTDIRPSPPVRQQNEFPLKKALLFLDPTKVTSAVNKEMDKVFTTFHTLRLITPAQVEPNTNIIRLRYTWGIPQQ